MPAHRRHRFYAAEVSYFSAKPRPALRYKQVPYDEILPTPSAYRDVIRPRTGLSQIPVLVTPEDEVVQDSSVILDELERRFPDPPLVPATPVQRLLGLVVELYGDEFLVVPAIHWRWSHPESAAKAVADFTAATGDATSATRFADAMRVFTRLVGVVPETMAGLEAHTIELVDALEAHLAAQPYLLGARPSLGDCALMGPFYAHFYLDAVPGRLLRERAPRVCHWIERMNHPDPEERGAWVSGDALSPTLHPLLRLAGADAVPLVLDVVRAFEAWADANAPVEGFLPRAVGTHRTQLRDVGLERLTTPYTTWMLQRVRDAYAALAAPARAAVDAAFAGTGCEALFAWTPRWRVRRAPCRLVLERA